MDILRYLPDGQDKPRSFAQLNSCLCSLLERHVEKGTENALKLLTHMRYLSDRSADTIHNLENILLYDADARKLASTKGMQVLEYGITPLMNKHLGLNSLKTSGGTNKSATSSGKSKWAKKRAAKSGGGAGGGSEYPCWPWNYKTCDEADCRKAHLCYSCKTGEHKAPNCKKQAQQPAA